MIVECPACHTRYRTDISGVIDDSTFFECTQEECRHVFPYSPPLFAGDGTVAPSPGLSSLAPLSEKSAVLSYEDEPDEAQINTAPSRPSRTAQPPAVEPLDELEDFSPPETPFFADAEEEDDGRVILSQPPSIPGPEVTFSLRPLLMLLGLIVLGHATLGVYCFFYPADIEAMLARLPLLGTLFTTERFSAQHVTLTELKSNYWLTKDNRRVFVVSGKATNNATVPARSIQVEGMIYDTNGKIVGQRMIFCGTETAATVLASLTVREIGILQNLVPPKQFNVPAGEAVNFLLVFTTPPPSIAEFSCRVVAAQFGSS